MDGWEEGSLEGALDGNAETMGAGLVGAAVVGLAELGAIDGLPAVTVGPEVVGAEGLGLGSALGLNDCTVLGWEPFAFG